MISRLKSRARSDRMVEQAKKARKPWDRIIYLFLLGCFGVALGNYMLGDRLFLRADGVVLRDRLVVASTALVRVSHVAVRPGQPVEAGDLLFQADSLDILGRLADLSMQDAALAERQAALRSQLAMARTLLPVATARRSELRDRLELLEARIAKRAVTVNRREDAQAEAHEIETEVLTLQARVAGLEQEIVAIGQARQHAATAIADMEKQYGGGLHRSSVTGIVGEDVPDPGEVFRPGEPIATILSGAPYVLAYLPDRYVFGVSVGDRVRVSGGVNGHDGTVEEVLAVSKSIPEEFRTAFRLDESRQLARVRLEPGAPFPAFSPVQVSKAIHPGGDAILREPIVMTARSVLVGMTGLGARIRGTLDAMWQGPDSRQRSLAAHLS